MSISRPGFALLAVSLWLSGGLSCRNAKAQALKLIPIPREVSAGAVQSLSAGLQIHCAAPCPAEDTFAIDDLKAWLAAQGIPVNATSPVNILVARYGTPIARPIYSDSLPQPLPGGAAAAEMPDEMKTPSANSTGTRKRQRSVHPAA